jgi:hypothetical protein
MKQKFVINFGTENKKFILEQELHISLMRLKFVVNFRAENKKFFLEQELHISLMKQKFVVSHRYTDFTGDKKTCDRSLIDQHLSMLCF